jgi:hypothetical protein
MGRPPVPVEQHPYVVRARRAVEAALAEQESPTFPSAGLPVTRLASPTVREWRWSTSAIRLRG